MVTDMRATERLLEVIHDYAAAIRDSDNPDYEYLVVAHHIADAITELRRRGDTLVRREDLRTVVEGMVSLLSAEVRADAYFAPSVNRLEIALGGKLR